jgi:hypothetical protein
MTTHGGQVRLRDLPRLGWVGRLNAFAAAVTLSWTGVVLGMGEVSGLLAGFTGVTLALGLANLYLLDRELREVSE